MPILVLPCSNAGPQRGRLKDGKALGTATFRLVIRTFRFSGTSAVMAGCTRHGPFAALVVSLAAGYLLA